MKNKKKLLIIIISIFAIALIILAVVFIFKNNKQDNNTINIVIEDTNILTEDNKNCTKKGNICSLEQIGKGIKYTVKVNKDTTKEFYMISNTENKVVLISNETFEDIVYSSESHNFFGPRTLVETIYNKTKDWNLIEPLNYKYEDKGNDYYYKMCETPETIIDDDEIYCGLGKNGIGFNYINYDSGIEYEDGFGNVINIGEGDIYARPATMEDMNNLLSYGQTVEWILNSEDFWLIDSDSQPLSGGIYSAKYVEPSKDSTYGFYINFDLIESKHGYKVVIELNKEA